MNGTQNAHISKHDMSNVTGSISYIVMIVGINKKSTEPVKGSWLLYPLPGIEKMYKSLLHIK
ncbi:hypothetical protein SAMN06265367_104342 [Algoriphagus winogradskyi]|uniref:Uncharacterized protein n=1 Tax=Algoriphagus winogradskyi TaxID=237017 RepID=A0ABY1P6M3_9BACT|nr:hypothetical protein SAMN06265367_104342 [Algoriphagus winogradskyi]